MSETAKLKLYLTENDQENFYDWREKLCGKQDSNMTKIDGAFLSVDEAISNIENNINGNSESIDDLKVSVESLSNNIDANNSRVTDIQSDINSVKTEMDTQIGAINADLNTKIGAINSAVESKADKSVSVEADLLSDAWEGESAPYSQSVNTEGVTAECNGSASLSSRATSEQRNAARDAWLAISSQGDGVLTIAADGEKPTIDIPITIILFG